MPGAQREFVNDGVSIARDARGFTDQIGGYVVESRDREDEPPHTRQIPDARLSGGLTRDQGTVDCHGLGRVFDAAGGAEPALSAQGMIGTAVRAAAASDPMRIPGEHFVEQAHAAAVGNLPLDPGARQKHGFTSIDSRVSSR